MSKHAHMPIRSGTGGVALFMRRILTGHAVAYNRRHRRSGHLFQNRYKSIVCEEDVNFTELVRYLHLNPLRAGLLTSLSQLDRYPWCGHAVVLGRRDCRWQDRGYVLQRFGRKVGPEKKAYREFVEKGIAQGQRPELVGGGPLRSLGGWSAVKSIRRSGVEEKGDVRILGSSEFVDQTIDEADRQVKHRLDGEDLIGAARDIVRSGCTKHRISAKLLRSGSRRQAVSNLLKHLTLELVNELGLSLAETGRQLGLTRSGVAQVLRRNR